MPRGKHTPNTPSEKGIAKFRENVDAACEEAARKIAEADVLLLCTGAGFSADSGLAVYADVARVEAYAKRGLKYDDICQPHWLDKEPALFWGFWGQCFNDYRNTPPHDGYRIVRNWVDRRFRNSQTAGAIRKGLDASHWPDSSNDDKTEPYAVDSRPSAFFAFTSNVDAHHFDWFEASEIHECHGNTEIYQCTDDCEALWRAPRDFRFAIDTATMLARGPKDKRAKQRCGLCNGTGKFDGDACSLCDGAGKFSDDEQSSEGEEEASTAPGMPAADAPRIGQVRGGGRPRALRYMPGSAPDADAAGFSENHPVCPHCGAPARPAILMFGDRAWRSWEQAWLRWVAWNGATQAVFESQPDRQVRAVILELGAGNNVATVRETSEETLLKWHEAGAEACLVRVNPDLPWPDDPSLRPTGANRGLVVSVMSRGLAALQKIDAAMPEHMRSAAETEEP